METSLKNNINRPFLRKERWPLLVYGLICCFILAVYFSNWVYDDPFITYRYANNIKHGLGFVFNPQERVLSTTTPLMALILAGLSFLWSDIHLLAIVIGAISIAFGAIILWDLGELWSLPYVGWVGLIIYPTYPAILSTIGSETPLYLMLCLGTFATYYRKNYSLLSFLAGAAVLVRPDAVLVPIIIFLVYVWENRKLPPIQSLLIFGGVLIVWIIFAQIYFGSPIPVTLLVKQKQGLMQISQSFLDGLIALIKSYSRFWYFLTQFFLLFLGYFYGTILKRKTRPFLLWPISYILGYIILGVSRYFWYYAPIFPGFAVGVGLGLSAILDYSKNFFITRRNNKSNQLLFILLVIILGVFSWRGAQQMSQYKDPRYSIYRAVGLWLKENTPENASIGMLEVGIMGYFSQRKIVDFAGLIQPEVALQIDQDTNYQDTAIWAVNHFQPDYLVLRVNDFPVLNQKLDSLGCIEYIQFLAEDYSYTQDVTIYRCH